jgi:hypothetical protein
MKKRTFAGLVLKYTFRRSVIATDRASILIGPMVTAYYWLRGGPMPTGLDGLIAVGILITAGAAILARFVSAPFVIWVRDQAQIRRLRTEVERPDRTIREAMANYKIELRKELGECISKIIAITELSRVPELLTEEMGIDHKRNLVRAREIINSLSYDIVLRVCCLNLLDLCGKVANAIAHNDQKNVRRLLDRLWAQRKLTFQLLHHEFRNDILALAQIENLIEQDGESFRSSKLPADEGSEDDLLLELRQMIKANPELVSRLDGEMEVRDADGS